MLPQLSQLQTEFENDVARITNLQVWEEVFLKYLGKKGTVNHTFALMATLDQSQKNIFGSQFNQLKQAIIAKLDQKKQSLLQLADEQWIDFTIPSSKSSGNLHLVTKTINEITDIFNPLGFLQMSYREVEWEYFAFEALNIPSDHPARDDVETFFVDAPTSKLGRVVLSPHTSSGQVREMQRLGHQPPIKMINIAKCYRPNWDVTHTPVFHQFEGLTIDFGISIPHLKGTIDHFVREFFGENTTTRLRPYNFRFTEPSFEVDISCANCKGEGRIENQKCKICKYGWLELGGAGMVHPKVLEAGGIDPEVFTGWAFGFGIERVAMMKGNLKLPDLRLLYSNDINYLKQF